MPGRYGSVSGPFALSSQDRMCVSSMSTVPYSAMIWTTSVDRFVDRLFIRNVPVSPPTFSPCRTSVAPFCSTRSADSSQIRFGVSTSVSGAAGQYALMSVSVNGCAVTR